LFWNVLGEDRQNLSLVFRKSGKEKAGRTEKLQVEDAVKRT
jgi:hypothetical protein